jgi:ubiquinone biosynthesis protein COQ4
MDMPPGPQSRDYGPFPAQRLKPVAALLAAIRLIRNTQDTQQVGLLEIALGGYSRKQDYERFILTETGRAVISERRSLVQILDDREYLRSLPENSLGRHYLAHMESEGLSIQGLLDATPAITHSLDQKPEPIRLFLNYAVRCAHDLHHVLAGYGRDELGETCVLAMAYQHVKIRGYKVIFTLGPLPVRRQLRRLRIDPRGVFAAIREAKQIGRESAWFPGLDIHAILGEDLDALRSRLNIRKPVIYNEIISRVRDNAAWRNGPWVHVPTPVPVSAGSARHTAI